MQEPDASASVRPPSTTDRKELPAWVTRVRERHPWVERVAAAAEMYGYGNVEFFSMKVVSRGLFLAVAMLLLLLFCLAFITSQLPGVNEITIPTMTLPDQVDLGAAVQQAYLATRGAVIGILGTVTLVVSATFTAKALRQGIRQVFDEHSPRVHTLDVTNLVTGLGIAVLGVCLWLMTLGTTIRTAALRQLLGVADLSPWLVNGAKITLIALQWGALALIVSRVIRRHDPQVHQRDAAVGAALFAAFVTVLNFAMIYSYVRALFDPDTSGSVVLVLSLLTWVNLVVRALFYTMCWAAVSRRGASSD